MSGVAVKELVEQVRQAARDCMDHAVDKVSVTVKDQFAWDMGRRLADIADHIESRLNP